jgi:hypothetical protein
MISCFDLPPLYYDLVLQFIISTLLLDLFIVYLKVNSYENVLDEKKYMKNLKYVVCIVNPIVITD